MSQASIIINVSGQDHLHSNGLSGTWIVPAKKSDEQFGILVVYPTAEIQDIGDSRKTVHWLKAKPLALDIVGMRSDAAAHGVGLSGNKEKWGLLLCEAEPDLPKELLDAQEAEMEYLNAHPPDIKMRVDPISKATVATNLYNSEPGEFDKRVELALTIQLLKEQFVADCRKLVSTAEIAKAKRNRQQECQRLIAEADRMWARPAEQANINELHRNACTELGQERVWCYTPKQLVPCPACAGMIPEGVITCSHCGGILDATPEEYAMMTPREKSMRIYPQRYAEPLPPLEPSGKKH
jgi:hypothetical protein